MSQPSQDTDFARCATESPRGGFLGEYWAFIRYHKKWWLIPILVLLGLFGLVIVLSGTAAAPFIYTLF